MEFSGRYHEVYDEVLSIFAPHLELRKLHDLAMPKGNVYIIDAGGGTGLLTRHLKSTDLRRLIEIFDLSREMKSVAVAKGVKKQNIHISSITELIRSNGQIVKANSADGVMSNNVLYILSLKQVHEFFQESARVLKVSGRLSVSSMRPVDRNKMNLSLQFMKNAIESMERDGAIPVGSSTVFFDTNKTLTQNAPTTFSNSEIVSLAKKYGFRPIVTDGEGYMGTVFFVSFEKI